MDQSHNTDRKNIEQKFKEDKRDLDEKTLQFLFKVNKLDNMIHINEYNDYLDYINTLNSCVPDFKNRIERNIVEEELLFSFIPSEFKNWDIAIKKLFKLSAFWENTKLFYDKKNDIMSNFSKDLELLNYIDEFNNIKKAIYISKGDVNEEFYVKINKIVDDDITVMIEFLNICNNIVEDEINKINFHVLGTKVEDIKNKNIDPLIKNTLQKLYIEVYSDAI